MQIGASAYLFGDLTLSARAWKLFLLLGLGVEADDIVGRVSTSTVINTDETRAVGPTYGGAGRFCSRALGAGR